MTRDLLAALHALTDLPGSIGAAVVLALVVGVFGVCMVPNITARVRGDR